MSTHGAYGYDIGMTRVMDGVRRGPEGQTSIQPTAIELPVEVVSAPARISAERPQPIKHSAVAARLPRGRLDGVRRQQPVNGPVRIPRPRPVMAAPVVAPAALPAVPTLATLGLPAVPQVPAPALPPLMSDIARPVAPMTAPEPPRSSWRADLLRRFAGANWQRPLVGFAMVAIALLASGSVVYNQSSPRDSTAHAERIVAKATPVPAATPSVELQKLLDTFAAEHQGKFSVYVKDLRTGQVASIRADQKMTSASLYKLFVAQRTLAQIDLGQWQLGSAAGNGTGRTIDTCLSIMITYSDNGCGRALGEKLGWGTQDQALAVEGYTDTTLASPQQTSARDVASLLERLYSNQLLSARSTEQLTTLLKSQHINNRLPQGLPSGIVVAHKTGDLDGYVHDAGIVYGPKTDYVVVVMSGPWGMPGTAPAQFAALSQQLWHYFEQ